MDGSRIVRLAAARWAVSVVVGVIGLALVAGGAIYGDYVSLKRHRAEFATLQTRLVEQQRIIDNFEARIRQVRTEMDTWTELHARIWHPLGPGMGPTAGSAGVGGGTALRHLEVPDVADSLAGELDRLVSAVTEAGDNLRALDQFMTKAGKVLAALPFRWPVRGSINSEFGRRSSPWASDTSEFHGGLDIGAREGTRVIAPAPGVVIFAGGLPEYGITLVIDHGNDIKSLYAHLSKLSVSAAEPVERGQMVALTGSTGRSSGPHLHYEIQVKGQPVNPRAYLWD